MAEHGQTIESSINALVVNDLYINEAGPLYISISGRRPGLIGWMLAKMKLSSTFVFQVHEKYAEYSDRSVCGEFTKTIPFKSVSNIESGYLKPFIYLVLTVVCIPLAFFTRWLSLVAIPFFLFSYYFGRTLKMSFISESGERLEFSFKRSVIEWVDLTELDATRISTIVTDLVQRNA